ncbi:MAG: phage terminase large subunit [Kiritimatiellae bacterium]|nr:phage terminase large subunit [Kiritimatiellia bacterium]
MDKQLLKIFAKIELARRDFFYYCHATSPDFYTPDRRFLVQQCKDFQDFVESDDYEVLIVNEPPRFGKSRTSQKFVEWVLGRDGSKKIMTGSYNTTLSTMFSKNVRNAIQEAKADKGKIIFSDIFPGVKIKPGDGAMNLWSLEGGYNNYLATSPGGTATGFGADLIIIDDLIKNSYEAHNEAIKQSHWTWFTDTMLSRLEEGGKIIIVMTRWASDDLAGRALEHFTKLGRKVKHINYKAVQDDGTLLCESILSHRSIELKKATIGLDIFNANYQQEPIDVKDRLYTTIKTYTQIPTDENGNSLLRYRLNYTDTADEGSDFLCSICYGMYEGSYYILDLLYTKDAMEVTEPATARMLTQNSIDCAIIESNNGGRAFARNIERICKEQGNRHTNIKWFHQSKNKVARILSNSTSVMNNVYFPVNWRDRWPEFARDIMKYQREGKNEHDDAPDALTGVYENPKPLGKWLM